MNWIAWSVKEIRNIGTVFYIVSIPPFVFIRGVIIFPCPLETFPMIKAMVEEPLSHFPCAIFQRKQFYIHTPANIVEKDQSIRKRERHYQPPYGYVNTCRSRWKQHGWEKKERSTNAFLICAPSLAIPIHIRSFPTKGSYS